MGGRIERSETADAANGEVEEDRIEIAFNSDGGKGFHSERGRHQFVGDAHRQVDQRETGQRRGKPDEGPCFGLAHVSSGMSQWIAGSARHIEVGHWFTLSRGGRRE